MKKDLNSFLEQYKIKETGDILLGIFQPGMTVYNQQLRALNIFYALHELGEISEGENLAIIGAGVAGMSFALAALDKGYEVDLFEKTSLLLPFQYGSDTRRIHPHFYNWPEPMSEYPYSELPFFQWRHETASTVSKDIFRGYRSILKKYSQQYNEFKNTLITSSDISNIGSRKEISFNSKTGHQQKQYDKLILAIGFGIEKRLEFDETRLGNRIKVLSDSYWRNDQYEQVNLYNDKVENYIVSGIGDGGFIDMFRLRIKGFTTDSIIQNLKERPEYDALILKLKDIKKEYRELLDAKKKVHATFLFDKLEQLYENKILESLMNVFEDRIRTDTQVILHHRNLQFREIFQLNKASLFNNLLAFILFKLNEVKYYSVDLKLNYLNIDKFMVTDSTQAKIDQQDQENKDNLINFIQEIGTKYSLGSYVKILIRHGADKITPLKNFGLGDKQIKNIEDIQLGNIDHNYLEPLWPYDFFEQSKSSKVFVEPDLVTLANTFTAGIASIVKHNFNLEKDPDVKFRICLHRVIKRSSGFYYQQVSDYFGIEESENLENKIGRIFPLKSGLVGYSLKSGRSLRLTRDEDLTAWHLLMLDEKKREEFKLGDPIDVKDNSRSILSCPIFSEKEGKRVPVFCLYMDSNEFLFKEDDGSDDIELLKLVSKMCEEFIVQIQHMVSSSGILHIEDLYDLLLGIVDVDFKSEPMNKLIERSLAELQTFTNSQLTFDKITPNYLTLNYRYKA